MHPALSVIFFTTLSGAGYGLLVLLAAAWLVTPNSEFSLQYFSCAALGLALIVVGLLSSTLHLGHPERAWMAFSQWRSSWLSREGVLAVLTFAPALVLTAATVFGSDITGWSKQLFSAAAVATLVLATATVFSTAMIYGSIRAVSAWHNRWVPLNYLMLALMSGFVLFNAIAAIFGHVHLNLVYCSSTIVVLAALFKNQYWRSIHPRSGQSDRQTALGLKANERAQSFIRPHSEDNYLLKEMGFSVARKHAAELRRYSVIAAFAVPLLGSLLLVLLPTTWAAIVAVAAAVTMMIGLLIERWLFFAEAKHTMSLYYGDAA